MKKVVSVLLASLILASSLAACAGNTDTPAVSDAETTPTVSADTTIAEETTAEPPETKYELAVKNADYGNFTFNVLTLPRQTAGNMYQYIDIDWAEDLEGDVYNDAIHQRNMKIEEDYKIVISVTQEAKPANILTNLVSSGDTTYSTVSFKMDEIMTMAQKNTLHDLSGLDALQLDAPWWDEAAVRDLSLGSKMFFVTGNLSVLEEEMLYLMMCNKKLLKDNNMEDPYEIVRQGKWTLDKLHSMAKGVNKDVDGNGVFDEHDRYGFANDYGTAHIHFYAGGGRTAEVGEDGTPKLTLMNEKNQEIIERIASFYHDKTAVVNASEINGTWTSLRVMMETDLLLFRAGCVYNIPYHRNMLSDFGILPLPKHTEEQEDYVHVVATNYATGFTVPLSLTGEAVNRTCVILAALAANSEQAVAAHYDVNLKSKNARDNDSADMLEIIFNSKYYDLGKTFRWNTIETKVIVEAIKTPGTFVSKYESNKTAAEKAMADTYKFFK